MVLSEIKQDLGQPIPQDSLHAASVVLPTWDTIVNYQNGDEDILATINGRGYPRFYMHQDVKEFSKKLLELKGKEGEECMVFMSHNISDTFKEYMVKYSEGKIDEFRVLKFSIPVSESGHISWAISVAFFPEMYFQIARGFRIITGMGMNSRLASSLLKSMFGLSRKSDVEFEGELLELDFNIIQIVDEGGESLLKPLLSENISSRHGRKLDFSSGIFSMLKGNFADMVNKSSRDYNKRNNLAKWKDVIESDTYLYPSGMGSIFSIHQALLLIFGTSKKSACFGFSYVDTKSILEKFGLGTYFLGFGDDNSLDELETQLENKAIDIFALFCEFPSNPLLKTPNLPRIRELAEKYKFAVVVDETIGNFTNVCVLPFADVIVTSLTKIVSGECDLMAGSVILNPSSEYYEEFKHYFNLNYETTLWIEDAILLEKRSKTLPERSNVINFNTLAVLDVLRNSPLVANIFYPNVTPGKEIYKKLKKPDGGYGGLFSVVFHDPRASAIFFDNLNIYKGPSLGTNFTLACPFTMLAHFNELDEVEKWGVDRNLVRVSIGLEDKDDLVKEFERSLKVTKLLLEKE